MSLRVNRLGALSPDSQTRLEDELGNAEGYHVQILNDLRVLGDSGKDVTAYKAELDSLGDRIVTLHTKIQTASNDSMVPQFQDEAASINKQLADLLTRTSVARQGVAEQSQLQGFYWALGVLAVAGATGFFVWRGSRRRRRR